MVMGLIKKVFGTHNDKELKRIQVYVDQINQLESRVQGLTDDQLRAKTGEFKEKLSQGVSLEDILPETFSVVREASLRTLNMRHFDVQLVGGAM